MLQQHYFEGYDPLWSSLGGGEPCEGWAHFRMYLGMGKYINRYLTIVDLGELSAAEVTFCVCADGRHPD